MELYIWLNKLTLLLKLLLKAIAQFWLDKAMSNKMFFIHLFSLINLKLLLVQMKDQLQLPKMTKVNKKKNKIVQIHLLLRENVLLFTVNAITEDAMKWFVMTALNYLKELSQDQYTFLKENKLFFGLNLDSNANHTYTQKVINAFNNNLEKVCWN